MQRKSLPDLLQGAKNSTLSLTEAFRGARPSSAIASSCKQYAPRPETLQPAPSQGSTVLAAQRPRSAAAAPGSRPAVRNPVLTKPQGSVDPTEPSQEDLSLLHGIALRYMRQRQIILDMTKQGGRVPRHIDSDFADLERTLVQLLRVVNKCFFQRFDDKQLQRLVRAMPMLKVSEGRYVFAHASLKAEWPRADGQHAFLLFSGQVSVFPDLFGEGACTPVKIGRLFGEKKFYLGDECEQAIASGSAHADETSIIGLINSEAVNAAFSDRLMGNQRIATAIPKVATLSTIGRLEWAGKQNEAEHTLPEDDTKDGKVSGAIRSALKALSSWTSSVHVRQGQELLARSSLIDSILVVSTGVLSVRADIHLTEVPGNMVKKRRVRLHVFVHKAEELAGDGFLDKLDPYALVKLGSDKRFQTPVAWNAGRNVSWDYISKFKYENEEELDIVIMDRDTLSEDALCGVVSVPLAAVPDAGWDKVWVKLKRPKTIFFGGDTGLEEFAGRVQVSLRWDLEAPPASKRPPREQLFRDIRLFDLEERSAFGHEQVVLSVDFRHLVERTVEELPYVIKIVGPLRFVADGKRGSSTDEVCTVWKIAGGRFKNFLQQTGRTTRFVKECNVDLRMRTKAAQKVCAGIWKKWSNELFREECMKMRRGIDMNNEENYWNPNIFMVQYRGTKCSVVVKNGINLPDGGLFDKLDPYAVLRFRNSKSAFKTSVLEDAGGEPLWNCEGELLYNGEPELRIQVFDHNRYTDDQLVAEGSLHVGSFYEGYNGMVSLQCPATKKSIFRKKKPMSIVISIDWPSEPTCKPQNYEEVPTSTFGGTLRLDPAFGPLSGG